MADHWSLFKAYLVYVQCRLVKGRTSCLKNLVLVWDFRIVFFLSRLIISNAFTVSAKCFLAGLNLWQKLEPWAYGELNMFLSSRDQESTA